jgi:hypothetical protein
MRGGNLHLTSLGLGTNLRNTLHYQIYYEGTPVAVTVQMHFLWGKEIDFDLSSRM